MDSRLEFALPISSGLDPEMLMSGASSLDEEGRIPKSSKEAAWLGWRGGVFLPKK
jgi:hypothetical protein